MAVGVQLMPGRQETLIYARDRILEGDWWRLWTAHWVHFGAAHLGWNLLVLVTAGAWVERLAPLRTRVFCFGAPPAISGSLLVFEPALARFAGLSGLATGVLALLALVQLSSPRVRDRWIWAGLLGLIGLKIVVEWGLARSLFVDPGPSEARPVPLAHLMGVACAGLAYSAGRRGDGPCRR